MKTAMSYWRHYAKDNRSGSKGSVKSAITMYINYLEKLHAQSAACRTIRVTLTAEIIPDSHKLKQPPRISPREGLLNL